MGEELPEDGVGVFVLEDDGEVVAMRTVGQFVWAGGMYVHPERRREGLATVIQANIEEALRSAGVHSYFMFPSTTPAEITVATFGLKKIPDLKVYRKEI